MTSTTTTTTPDLPGNSVLIFHGRRAVIDNNGKEEHAGVDFRFTFGEKTEVRESCSVTWHGEFFVFGGHVGAQIKQISKMNGCSLERIGTLSFEHNFATCAVVNDETIYLCFNDNSTNDYKKCRKGNDPLGVFKEINQTKYKHHRTRIGASSGKH